MGIRTRQGTMAAIVAVSHNTTVVQMPRAKTTTTLQAHRMEPLPVQIMHLAQTKKVEIMQLARTNNGNTEDNDQSLQSSRSVL